MSITVQYYTGLKTLIMFILDEWNMLLVLTTIFAIYFYYTNTFDYFKKRGIKFKKPTIFFGNLGSRLLAKKSFHAIQIDIYNDFKGDPYGGYFEGRRPVMYLFDLELIKSVTIRDFEYFVDRNSFNSKQPGYLKKSLLNLKGTEWKSVRNTLTPAFSSARLKNMLPLIQHCSQQLVEYLKQYDKVDVEMKDTMGHFTLEVIGACAFGIKCDALTDENAHFVKVAEKFNYMPKTKRIFLLLLLVLMPRDMFKYINISFLNEDSVEELVGILKKAKEERRSSGVRKNDFLQLLIDAADSEQSEIGATTTKKNLDDDTIDAQSLLFLIAGYETSSTLLSFAIHVLATKPDLQDKLRAHINDVIKGKDVTYELLAQLPYLEGFLLETLRMYPPVSRVDRVCTKRYTLPGTSVHLDVGDVVAVPIYGIHMDPDIYPEPGVFRPERFVGEEKKERPSHLFLAFGAGPRNCIGLRFAMISAKMAMIALVMNFKFSACAKTDDPIKIDKRAVLLKAESGLWVHLDVI